MAALLHLLPNLLGDQAPFDENIPSALREIIPTLDGLIAESEKAGRRFLSRFLDAKETRNLPIAVYGGGGGKEMLDFLLEPLQKGEQWGLLSDAGLPCIADPGADLVREAREQGISVRAWVGPCSFLLALMLSGLSGQQFSFHGYLPRQPEDRRQALRRWEKNSREERMTHLFMEAPYRNRASLRECLEVLEETTSLCLAWDLTLPSQQVFTKKVGEWKEADLPEMEKKPLVFLFSAERAASAP